MEAFFVTVRSTILQFDLLQSLKILFLANLNDALFGHELPYIHDGKAI